MDILENKIKEIMNKKKEIRRKIQALQIEEKAENEKLKTIENSLGVSIERCANCHSTGKVSYRCGYGDCNVEECECGECNGKGYTVKEKQQE